MRALYFPLVVSMCTSFAVLGPARCQEPAPREAAPGADLAEVAARPSTVSVDGERVTVSFAERSGTTILQFAEDVSALTGVEIFCEDPEVAAQVIGLSGVRSLEKDQLIMYFMEVVRGQGACLVAYGTLGAPFGAGPANGYLLITRTNDFPAHRIQCFVRRMAPVVAPSDLAAFRCDETTLTTGIVLHERDAQATVDVLQAGLRNAVESCRAVAQSNAVVLTGSGRALFEICGVIELGESTDSLAARRLPADGVDVLAWAAAVEAAYEAAPNRRARIVADPEGSSLAVFAPEAELDAACAWVTMFRPAARVPSDCW